MQGASVGIRVGVCLSAHHVDSIMHLVGRMCLSMGVIADDICPENVFIQKRLADSRSKIRISNETRRSFSSVSAFQFLDLVGCFIFRRSNAVVCAPGSRFVRGLLFPLSWSELILPTFGPRRRLRDVWFCSGDVEL